MRSHIRRLLESAGFSPKQLFAALQGAWLEPKQGFIWQENTGVTPTTTGGQTIGKIADLSGYGNVATQATAANRPTLQFNGALPLARFDTNDFLSLSLPAINVRRNLLTYSEQFDNGVWRAGFFGAHVKPTVTANTCLAPDGTVSAETLTATHDGASTIGGAFLSAIPGTSYTASFWIKAGSSTAARIVIAWGTGNVYVSAVSSPASALTNQFIRYTLTGTCPASGVTQLQACLLIGNGKSGALGKTVEVFGAQLELGSVATDYQKITDWTSEAYSSNGSVYFSTPVGMSSLHNQSMGTTYQLPALSSDIYSWMVFPQRLSAVQESRLALYMQQKAGIAGPEYLLDSADGQLTADDGLEILLAQ